MNNQDRCVQTEPTRTVISPNDGRAFAEWRTATQQDADRLLGRLVSARRTLDGSLLRRQEILGLCIAGLRSVRSDLTALVVREVGKRPAEAEAEFDYAVSFLDHYRRLLDTVELRHEPEPGRLVTEVGAGGALLICPFNDPLAGLTRKIAPAIAAGCPAIVKPSSLAMLCASAVFEAFRNAGVGGEIQLLPASDPTIARQVIGHEEIGIVSFTGSTEVGRELSAVCAANGKRAVMELGGNCPFVVFNDADLEGAVSDLLERKLKAAGQACSSVNRVIVEGGIYARFRKRLLELAASVVAGPSDQGVDLGPVRTREAANQLVKMAADVQSDGEKLLTPMPKQVAAESSFVIPLTVVESGDCSRFDQIETFGPLLSVRKFAGREALLARLARERHALAAYFYTGQPGPLIRQLRDLRFGSIGINSTAIQGALVPTGGFRDAGFGREGGIWGLREFTTTINWRQEAQDLPDTRGGQHAGNR